MSWYERRDKDYDSNRSADHDSGNNALCIKHKLDVRNMYMYVMHTLL